MSRRRQESCFHSLLFKDSICVLVIHRTTRVCLEPTIEFDHPTVESLYGRLGLGHGYRLLISLTLREILDYGPIFEPGTLPKPNPNPT